MSGEGAFDFVPITRADYPLVAGWLRTPAVARWWCDSPEPEALEAEYGGVVDGVEAAEVFIAHRAGRPIGLVQRFALAAYPDYEAEIAQWTEVPAKSWSIDYFIGEPQPPGTGTALIAQLTRSVWACAPDAPAILVPVHADNRASWRVLERNGYRRVAEARMAPDNPVDSDAHCILRIDRPAAA
jgi:aminoglycoside 6'-N-acetyltransferase